MIKQFLEWLISHYYTPAQAGEPQSTGDAMSEPLVDTSVGTAAQAQPAAVETQPAATLGSDTILQPVTSVVASTSALDKAKADFEKFVAFVEHGIAVLGKEAESKLAALKDEFL